MLLTTLAFAQGMANIMENLDYQIVGILVRLTEDRGIAPLDVTPELLDEAAILYMGEPVDLDPATLADSLDPTASVLRRTLYGGPAPEEASLRMKDYRDDLEIDRGRFEAAREPVLKGARLLEEAIDRLLG